MTPVGFWVTLTGHGSKISEPQIADDMFVYEHPLQYYDDMRLLCVVDQHIDDNDTVWTDFSVPQFENALGPSVRVESGLDDIDPKVRRLFVEAAIALAVNSI